MNNVLLQLIPNHENHQIWRKIVSTKQQRYKVLSPALMVYFFLPNRCDELLLYSVQPHTHSWKYSPQTSTDTLSNGSYRLQLFKGCHVITVQRQPSSEALDALRLHSGST